MFVYENIPEENLCREQTGAWNHWDILSTERKLLSLVKLLRVKIESREGLES